MFNKKWKAIAAIAMSFSLMMAATGFGTTASPSEGGAREKSTLDIADQAPAQEAGEEGSLLDLADSIGADDAGDAEESDGLLALIDAEGSKDDTAETAEPAPEEVQPNAEAEPAPEEVPQIAEAEPAPEEIPQDAEAEAVPEEVQPEADADLQAEPAPADENIAQLNQAAPEEPAAEEAAPEENEAPVYEKLEATGSLTEGIVAMDISEIVRNTMPSIVAVTCVSPQKVRNYFSGEEYEIDSTGAGSGIIISQNSTELLIVTNHHITMDSKDLSVAFSVEAENEDDLVVPAVIKGESNKADIAVIAVQLSDIKPEVYSQLKIATLGSSDKLKVGEAAIMIGNALGYGQAASAGIVSALNREVVTELGTFTEFMIDAPINLGCSGGAILNSKGEVVGIVNCKDVNDYAESMGYGVPIDEAIPILEDLINRVTRSVVDEHGFLGITVFPVSEEARSMYDMPAGAYVYEVAEGSAAEAAGIEKGNIITTFDGIEIDGSDDLVDLVSRYEVGETVKVGLKVPDGGSYADREVEVTLQAGAPSEDTEDEKAEEKQEEEKQEQEEKEKTPDQNVPDDEYSNYGYGPYGDPFEWFFGDSYGGRNDGWGNFYFGD